MRMLKCLIIDDEPLAREIIERHVSDTPGLMCCASLGSALEGVEYLEENGVDLLFLDINMPKLSGLHFLRNLTKPPLTILTTAYPEHAVESYELDAIDYLLKPIALGRFLKAVNKAKERLETTMPTEHKVILKSDKKIYRVPTSQVLYLEGLGDYLKVFVSSETKPIIVQSTMKGMIASLGKGFMRIHKSYVVNTTCIGHLDGNELSLSNGTKLPIGYSYRKEVNAFMME